MLRIGFQAQLNASSHLNQFFNHFEYASIENGRKWIKLILTKKFVLKSHGVYYNNTFCLIDIPVYVEPNIFTDLFFQSTHGIVMILHL